MGPRVAVETTGKASPGREPPRADTGGFDQAGCFGGGRGPECEGAKTSTDKAGCVELCREADGPKHTEPGTEAAGPVLPKLRRNVGKSG